LSPSATESACSSDSLPSTLKRDLYSAIAMASPPRERAATASPQLRTPREERTYLRKNHNSPYRHSPRRSDVLVDDFSTLHMREERAWRELQDVKDAEQQYLHQQALAQAAAEHDRILKSAIEAAELEALKLERERKQKEEREHRALESERLAKAEREALERQRVKKELERQEEEQKKRAAEEREIQETQARLAEQKRKDETDTQQRKAEREAAERKIKEEADAPSASVPAVNPQPTPQPPVAAPQQTAAPAAKSSPPSVTRPAVSNNSATTASPLKSSPAQAEAIHKQYLTIHQNLKSMRKETLSLCKKNPAYGLTNIGDYRRKLATMMGQFTIFKDKNREVVSLNCVGNGITPGSSSHVCRTGTSYSS
jgi:nucleoporin GLE1